MMPLLMVAPGREVVLTEIRSGHGMKNRLAGLGLVPGVSLRVVCSNLKGPLVVSVKGTRVALGRGMAHRIMVD